MKAEALELLGMFQVLPRLVVFDLDYTLWPYYWYMILSLFLPPEKFSVFVFLVLFCVSLFYK